MEDQLILLETKSQGAVQLPKERRESLTWFKPPGATINACVFRAKDGFALLVPAGLAADATHKHLADLTGKDWAGLLGADARISADGRLYLTDATRAHILGNLQTEGKFWAIIVHDAVLLFPESARLQFFSRLGPDFSDVSAEYRRTAEVTPIPSS